MGQGIDIEDIKSPENKPEKPRGQTVCLPKAHARLLPARSGVNGSLPDGASGLRQIPEFRWLAKC